MREENVCWRELLLERVRWIVGDRGINELPIRGGVDMSDVRESGLSVVSTMCGVQP